VGIFPSPRRDRALDAILERLARIESGMMDAGNRLRSLEQTEAVREASILDITDKLTRLYKRQQARVQRVLDSMGPPEDNDGAELIEPINGGAAPDPISAAILARRATYARRTD